MKINFDNKYFLGLCFHSILILSLIVIIFPFSFMISASLDKITTLTLPFPPRIFPKNLSLFNYKILFQNMPVLIYLFNSIIIVIINVVLTILIGTMAGFALSKGKFRFKSFILIFILTNMMVPFETRILFMFGIIRNIGLTNTYLGVVLPGVMTNSFCIFLVKQYCDIIPDSLYEAGTIDGASKFRIYFQIFMPLLKPIIATLVVLTVIAVWNDLLWPMIIMTKSKLWTIQIGLSSLSFSPSMGNHPGINGAMSVLSIVPILGVFIFAKRYVIQSVSISAGIKE